MKCKFLISVFANGYLKLRIPSCAPTLRQTLSILAARGGGWMDSTDSTVSSRVGWTFLEHRKKKNNALLSLKHDSNLIETIGNKTKKSYPKIVSLGQYTLDCQISWLRTLIFFFSVQPASQSASKNYKKAIFSFAFSLLNWKTVEIILGVRMGLDTGMLYTGKGCWPSGPTGARILCPLQSKPLHADASPANACKQWATQKSKWGCRKYEIWNSNAK